MTQAQYMTSLESELQRLNERIDLKILFGQSYADEARRHKMLREQSRKLRMKKHVSMVVKFLSPFYK